MKIRWFAPRRIFSRLLLSYLAITLIILVVVSFVFVHLMHRYFFSVEGVQLSMRAEKAAALLQEPLQQGDIPSLDNFTETLAFTYDVYILVTNRDGSILISAGDGPEKLGLKVEQHEIDHVLAGNIITKQITGPGYNSLFYMAPVYEPGYEPDNGWDAWDSDEADTVKSSRIIGTLAISSPLAPISVTISGITRLGSYAAFGAAFLALIIGYNLSRRIANPLEEMNRVALALSRGDYGMRVSYQGTDELGQLAETLNFAIDKVSTAIDDQRRTLKQQQDLISDISHEFRAPLTTLQGFLELMRGGKIGEDEYQKYFEIMHRDALHLSRLVQDLLELDGLESSRAGLELSGQNPLELLNDSVQRLQHQAAAKEITLEVFVDSCLPEVKVDRNRFHQVMVNLVENAVRYSPVGEKITLGASVYQSGVLFAVSDCGPGIPEDALPHIWNRFFKVDKARTRGETGSGLGLAIVHRIVDMHDGWVSVKTSCGKGSVFNFWLPSDTGEAKNI